MKKILCGIVLALLCMVGVPKSQAAIVENLGAAIACDTAFAGCAPIPLTLSTLCSASCPLRTGYSKTVSTRFWGASSNALGACTTSSDGGITWGACTAQPFASGAGVERYQGTADGGVVAASGLTGPNRCQFAKSMDNGVTWTPTSTITGTCGDGTLEGMTLYCIGATCHFVSQDASSQYETYKSTNNGDSWTLVDGPTAYGINSQCGAVFDGTSGAYWPCQSIGSGNRQSWFTTSAVWGISAVWGGTGECWGGYILSGTGHMVCSDGTTYTIRDTAGTVEKTVVFPGAIVTISSGGTSWGYGTSTVYVAASLTTSIGIYVSTDSGTTFLLLSSIATSSTRGGNAFLTNGCIYWTIGSPAKFVKVC